QPLDRVPRLPLRQDPRERAHGQVRGRRERPDRRRARGSRAPQLARHLRPRARHDVLPLDPRRAHAAAQDARHEDRRGPEPSMSALASSSAFDPTARPLPLKLANQLLARGERLLRLPRLDPTRLLRDARERTGLSDFGPDDFREGLEVLCDSIENEAKLHPIGRLILHGRIRGALETRLRAEALLKRHPEIHQIPITAPIVIAGLQRTGTTMLHRLLASDPRVRSLASWEALSPVPEKLDAPRDRDPRIRSAVIAEKGLRVMSPEFFAIHPVEAHAPEEEVILLD